MNATNGIKLLNKEGTQRLDQFLVSKFSSIGRRRARDLCNSGAVRVNGRREKPGYQLKVGDEIELDQVPLEVAARAEVGDTSELEVVLEDEDFLVVSKPREMNSITLRREDPLTLADCIAAYYPNCLNASPDKREAGLVQRLDFSTSGLVLAAKNSSAWENLRDQLFTSKIAKSYVALVEGELEREEVLVCGLAQSADGTKMIPIRSEREAERHEKVFSAETKFTPIQSIERNGSMWTLLRANGRRVRRHQIRVHASVLSHPLVGDDLYGSKAALKDCLGESAPQSGFLLHAEMIGFFHPRTNERIEVRKELELEL